MFFSVFWTVYIPVVTIILCVVGEWLIRFFRQLRGHAWLAPSNRRRISRSNESRVFAPVAEPRSVFR